MVDFTKKMNLQGVLDNIKSLVNPAGETPSPSPDDAVGNKVAELSVLIQELAATNAEQAKKLAKVNRLFNALYKDIELLRQPTEEVSEGEKEGVAASEKQGEKVSVTASEKEAEVVSEAAEGGEVNKDS